MKKIFLIDDDEFIHHYIIDIVSDKEKTKIFSFYNSKNLLSQIIKERPDLIILDFYLPNSTALDILHLIKQNKSISYIPIIIITGASSSIEIKTKILEAGADAFISKPFQKPEILAQINLLIKLHEIQKSLIEKHKKLEKILYQQKSIINENEERWKLFLETTNDGIWEWNILTDEFYISEGWLNLFEYNKSFKDLNSFIRIIHKDEVDHIKTIIKKYLRKELNFCKFETRIRSNNNGYKWQLCHGQAVWKEGKPIRMMGILTDITDQKEVEVRLRALAHHDGLTGLPNRILAQDRAEVALEVAKRVKRLVGFFFLDLDGFKYVNDQYGHNIGDLLLKQVGVRILSILRKFDTLARVGGDEFLIISTNVNQKEDLELIASRCLEVINKQFIIENITIKISTSIGISYFPKHGNKFNILKDKADVAMYNSKMAGKNKYFFYKNSYEKDLNRKSYLKSKIVKAIQNNEICKFVQPIYYLEDKKIYGYESLLRWKPTNNDFILPREFIYLIDETGLMLELTEMVMKYYVNLIYKQKIDADVHINLLYSEFTNINFLKLCYKFENELCDFKNTFCFEITENTLMQDINNSLSIINKLKLMGYKICIDNFGTGSFSLRYLTDLGIDSIKIDRYFVKNIQDDIKHYSLWEAVINLCNKLSITTIAVGIENINDYKIVKSMGIKVIQGNYLNSPYQIK